jgi:regulator of replication initiation timing
MAKVKPKEAGASIPLICALVFFVLTTIAFGVMWYLSFAEIETKTTAAKKAEDDKKPLKDAAREAEQKARLYRLYIGIEEPTDRETIDAERTQGTTISTELSKINEAVAQKLGAADASKLPPDFRTFWELDENKKAKSPPVKSLLTQIADVSKKEDAYKKAEEERASYRNQIKDMQATIESLKAAKQSFEAATAAVPVDAKAARDEVTKALEGRIKKFDTDQAEARKKINDVLEERDRLNTDVRKLRETLATLQADNQILLTKISDKDKSQATFDEPQGKILRKLPEGVVELNIGSAAGVLPGLTFTVLPPDFPEKGRQSRVRMLRVPDGRNGFKSVETFVPKGSIEVYEVVGPNLSLARIQAGSELDPIRDGIAVGDLIYNSVWRKGVADHIALVGIFDINGDGTDDIESVVKDLRRMGIPVDAYYDMKKRQWIGQVTERTRYIVEGYLPINTANDPNRDEKTKLLDALGKAISEGKSKGVNSINFRDFFSRMGYKFRLDVSDDKVNQATAPYLSNVGVGGPTAAPKP